jgi:glyceraldehyde 3-phosphate dehydrogenase
MLGNCFKKFHGKFNANLDYDENHLIINKNKITFSQESKIEEYKLEKIWC